MMPWPATSRTLSCVAVVVSLIGCTPKPAPSTNTRDIQASSSTPTVAPLEADPPPPEPTLTVHEWGTFTARVDGKGKVRSWNSADRVDALPKFVFQQWVTNTKQQVRGTVRMETPVLYFYANVATKASASVSFPAGFLTEWYPSALHDSQSLSWNDFQVLPGGLDPEYPVDGDSHYYAARATDASPLEVTAGDGNIEREKLLFYRGVGTFALPLEGRPTKAGIELVAKTPVAGVIVLSRRGTALGWESLGTLDPNDGPRSVARPSQDDDLEGLSAEVERLLVGDGLYPREAQAMIATWRDLWFEDGLRVLYLVPREFTDQTLPLTLDPTPDELVRVLVGRLDFPS